MSNNEELELLKKSLEEHKSILDQSKKTTMAMLAKIKEIEREEKKTKQYPNKNKSFKDICMARYDALHVEFKTTGTVTKWEAARVWELGSYQAYSVLKSLELLEVVEPTGKRRNKTTEFRLKV